MNVKVLSLGFLLLLSTGPLPLQAERLAENSVWHEVAAEYRVDPAMLYSIALAESRRTWADGLARPWPWVINSRKYGARWFETEQEAIIELKKLIEDEGDQEVAIGLMQIWYAENGHLMPSINALIQPANNIRAGAQIYREALRATGNHPGKALGIYNSGRAVVTEYSRQVLQIHKSIKNQFLLTRRVKQ